MDLHPSGAYGISNIDANADTQVYGQHVDRTLSVPGGFTYNLTKDWPETAGSTTVQTALDRLQQTGNHKDITGNLTVDPLTDNRVNAEFRRQAPKKITLIQAPPAISHDEDEDPTSGRGDFTFFDASLSREGKPFGSLTGTIETHDIVTGSENLEVRFRTLVFELPKGQLVAQGTSSYTTGPDFVPLNINNPVVIAVTGGTGDYIGATGEVRTTRRADGTYRQVITLLRNDSGKRKASNNKE